MRIGELSKAAGVDVETIRYYERIGLMPAPARGANGYRAYTRKQLTQLAFIRHCRALDIALVDIRRLLTFADAPEEDCGDIDQLIDEQLERVRARLDSLRGLECELQRLRGCCSGNHSAGDCGILQELAHPNGEHSET